MYSIAESGPAAEKSSIVLTVLRHKTNESVSFYLHVLTRLQYSPSEMVICIDTGAPFCFTGDTTNSKKQATLLIHTEMYMCTRCFLLQINHNTIWLALTQALALQ